MCVLYTYIHVKGQEEQGVSACGELKGDVDTLATILPLPLFISLKKKKKKNTLQFLLQYPQPAKCKTIIFFVPLLFLSDNSVPFSRSVAFNRRQIQGGRCRIFFSVSPMAGLSHRSLPRLNGFISVALHQSKVRVKEGKR